VFDYAGDVDIGGIEAAAAFADVLASTALPAWTKAYAYRKNASIAPRSRTPVDGRRMPGGIVSSALDILAHRADARTCAR
jgi:hypothetical protein